jgi:cell division protein FtsB
MNQSSQDEYEEVESPFASKTSAKTTQRLRTRKNVFNRPFATDSTNAPTYFETTATRKAIGGVDNTELIERRQSALQDTEIEYLEDEEVEEEEEAEKLPARKSSTNTKKKEKTKRNILAKAGWAVVGLLVLRLITMDRGVWDYFSTEGEIREKRDELKSIQTENKELKNEITRIQLDRNYQKQLAKEHLGVIAADEFLILFAGEGQQDEQIDPKSI